MPALGGFPLRACPLRLLGLLLQKLSALSASLVRVVAPAQEDEVEMDEFPVEGVRAWRGGSAAHLVAGRRLGLCSVGVGGQAGGWGQHPGAPHAVRGLAGKKLNALL